tara:strand:- start:624 stop:899 length:276 start_codon:yes stop_codon:yes gene_type:complete
MSHDSKSNASPSVANRNSIDLGAISLLLPTPRAQNGEDRNSKPWLRPLDQPQNLENTIARMPTDSESGHQPSLDGERSSNDPLPIPPTTDD